MKALDDVLLDDADVDLNGKHKKSKQESEDDAEYRRWQKRVEMVKWSNTDYRRFVKFLNDNKDYFIRESDNYGNRARAEMRRICQRAYDRNMWISGDNDSTLFNQCFGPYKEAVPEWSDIQKTYVWDNPDLMTFDNQVLWYADSSYKNWWNYIHSEKFLSAFPKSDFTLEKWNSIVDDVKLLNRQFFKGEKVYEPSDEQYYDELRGMIQ